MRSRHNTLLATLLRAECGFNCFPNLPPAKSPTLLSVCGLRNVHTGEKGADGGRGGGVGENGKGTGRSHELGGGVRYFRERGGGGGGVRESGASGNLQERSRDRG